MRSVWDGENDRRGTLVGHLEVRRVDNLGIRVMMFRVINQWLEQKYIASVNLFLSQHRQFVHGGSSIHKP
jgi:hypothetical protein